MKLDWGQIVLATGNRGKSQEFATALGVRLPTLVDLGIAGEPDESGESYAANALIKARYATQRLERWALADDTGLEVEALGGAPGLLTARYAGPQASAVQNRARLLEALAGIDESSRRARFVCHLCLAAPDGSVAATATGCCVGRIRMDAAGSGGFGYDALFEVVEYHCTLAELGGAAKATLSHRGRALRALAECVDRAPIRRFTTLVSSSGGRGLQV